MSFRGCFVPEELGGQRLGAFPSLILRGALAAALAVAVVSLGSVAMLFTTGPEWASLLFEPISLLLLPGMFVSMVASGPHDVDPQLVMFGTVVLYFVFFWAMLEGRAWRQRRRRRQRG